MDQKDSNLNSANAPQQEEHKVRRLASAAELRGSKSGSAASDKSGKKGGKMWVSLTALLVVLVVAVVVCVAAVDFKPVEPEKTEAPTVTLEPVITYPLFDTGREVIKSVTVQIAGEEPYTVNNIVNVSGEGANAVTAYQYAIEGIKDFNMEQSKVSALVGYAAYLSAIERIEENAADLAPYGLDNPSMTFTVTYTDGTQDVMYVGKQVPTDNSYYVRKQDSQSVYVLYNTAYNGIHLSLNELAVARMPVVLGEIHNVVIEQKGKETIELQYDAEVNSTFSISTMKMVRPFKYDTNSDRIGEITNGCLGLTITTYAGEKNLMPEAGLDEPRAKLHITDAEGNVLNYTVGNYKDEKTVYVQVDDSETVYLADASTLKFLDSASVSYLIDQYTNLVNILSVEELAVTVGEKVYMLTIDREFDLDESGNYILDAKGIPVSTASYYFDGAVVSEKEFRSIYLDIIGLMMSKVSPDYAFEGNVAARLDFKLSGEPSEYVVEYLEYDNQYYAVRRDNQTIALVKRERIDSIFDKLATMRSTVGVN